MLPPAAVAGAAVKADPALLHGCPGESPFHSCRGRALWKVGGSTAVVQHVIGRTEWFCDTDSRMAA